MASALMLYGESVVISSTTNGSPNFIPLTQWVRASEVLKARATLEMRGQANSCQISGAYQTSDDQITVGTPTALVASNFLTADGIQFPSTFPDISTATNAKGWVRFGLLCQPASGTAVSGCWASIKVDIQGA
jgi:hypothetical protein